MNISLKFNKTRLSVFIKILFIFLLIITSILFFLWFKNIYENNKMISKYKEYYEVIQNELKYCDSIQNTAQPRDNFVYCDRLMNKFNKLSEN